jgi:hypothetical protein
MKEKRLGVWERAALRRRGTAARFGRQRWVEKTPAGEEFAKL